MFKSKFSLIWKLLAFTILSFGLLFSFLNSKHYDVSTFINNYEYNNEGKNIGNHGLMKLIMNATRTVLALETQSEHLDQTLQNVHDKADALLRHQLQSEMWFNLQRCGKLLKCDNILNIANNTNSTLTTSTYDILEDMEENGLEMEHEEEEEEEVEEVDPWDEINLLERKFSMYRLKRPGY